MKRDIRTAGYCSSEKCKIRIIKGSEAVKVGKELYCCMRCFFDENGTVIKA